MAKKAAALQAFQKADLDIPDTILEDDDLEEDTRSREGREEVGIEVAVTHGEEEEVEC